MDHKHSIIKGQHSTSFKQSEQMSEGPLLFSWCVKLEWVTESYFSYFSTKTYVVGNQNNHLDETVLLGTQNTCLYLWLRK